MNTKTRAEVWADMVETMAPGAAKELLRLSASEAALLEALEMATSYLTEWHDYLSEYIDDKERVNMPKFESLIARTKEARNG